MLLFFRFHFSLIYKQYKLGIFRFEVAYCVRVFRAQNAHIFRVLSASRGWHRHVRIFHFFFSFLFF